MSGGHGWACRSASRPGLWRGAAAAFAEEERCDLIGGTGGEGGEGKVGPGREGLMALASAGCEMPTRRRILLALALSCQGCGLQNWRLWRLRSRRLCSVFSSLFLFLD